MKGLTFIIIAIVFGLDRITKFIVQQTMYEGESRSILQDIFSLSYIKNEGISFGLFSNHSQWLIVTGFLTTGIILVIFFRLKNMTVWIASSFGLILGGAIGNLWDRVCLGAVVDFIDVGVKNYRWPTFNVADSAICIGVLMLLLTINKKTKDRGQKLRG